MLVFLMVIAVAFFIGLHRSTGRGKAESILISLCYAGMSGSACLLLLMIVITTFSTSATQYVEKGKIEIISLRNILSLEGDFFIGTGTLDSKLYYVYYYKSERGGSKLTKVSAEKTELFEEDRRDAYLAEVDKTITRPGLKQWDWLFVPWFLLSDSSEYDKALHIPRGTIKKNINLDLRELTS